jgi:hypothetical protein
MDRKIFHGTLNHNQIARSLAAKFHRGNLSVRIFGEPQRSVVQIATSGMPSSGGRTAMNVIVQQVEDGVSIQVGQQDFLGVAASLGASALTVFRNPLSILGRLDDIAQDIESLRLSEEVWRTIEETAAAANATTELSERLRRLPCNYCNTANPPGEPRCIACGAPLGDIQPRTCLRCGFVVLKDERVCPNCRTPLS